MRRSPFGVVWCVLAVCVLGCSCRSAEPAAPLKPAAAERAFTPGAEPFTLYEVQYNGKRRSMSVLSSLVYAPADALVLVDFPDDEEVPDQFYLVERRPNPLAPQTARLISSPMLTALASARWHAADEARRVDSTSALVVIDALREGQREQALKAEEAARAAKIAKPRAEPALVVDSHGGTPDLKQHLGLNPKDVSDIKQAVKDYSRRSAK